MNEIHMKLLSLIDVCQIIFFPMKRAEVKKCVTEFEFL